MTEVKDDLFAPRKGQGMNRDFKYAKNSTFERGGAVIEKRRKSWAFAILAALALHLGVGAIIDGWWSSPVEERVASAGPTLSAYLAAAQGGPDGSSKSEAVAESKASKTPKPYSGPSFESATKARVEAEPAIEPAAVMADTTLADPEAPKLAPSPMLSDSAQAKRALASSSLAPPLSKPEEAGSSLPVSPSSAAVQAGVVAKVAPVSASSESDGAVFSLSPPSPAAVMQDEIASNVAPAPASSEPEGAVFSLSSPPPTAVAQGEITSKVAPASPLSEPEGSVSSLPKPSDMSRSKEPVRLAVETDGLPEKGEAAAESKAPKVREPYSEPLIELAAKATVEAEFAIEPAAVTITDTLADSEKPEVVPPPKVSGSAQAKRALAPSLPTPSPTATAQAEIAPKVASASPSSETEEDLSSLPTPSPLAAVQAEIDPASPVSEPEESVSSLPKPPEVSSPKEPVRLAVETDGVSEKGEAAAESQASKARKPYSEPLIDLAAKASVETQSAHEPAAAIADTLAESEKPEVAPSPRVPDSAQAKRVFTSSSPSPPSTAEVQVEIAPRVASASPSSEPEQSVSSLPKPPEVSRPKEPVRLAVETDGVSKSEEAAAELRASKARGPYSEPLVELAVKARVEAQSASEPAAAAIADTLAESEKPEVAPSPRVPDSAQAKRVFTSSSPFPPPTAAAQAGIAPKVASASSSSETEQSISSLPKPPEVSSLEEPVSLAVETDGVLKSEEAVVESRASKAREPYSEPLVELAAKARVEAQSASEPAAATIADTLADSEKPEVAPSPKVPDSAQVKRVFTSSSPSPSSTAAAQSDIAPKLASASSSSEPEEALSSLPAPPPSTTAQSGITPKVASASPSSESEEALSSLPASPPSATAQSGIAPKVASASPSSESEEALSSSPASPPSATAQSGSVLNDPEETASSLPSALAFSDASRAQPALPAGESEVSNPSSPIEAHDPARSDPSGSRSSTTVSTDIEAEAGASQEEGSEATAAASGLKSARSAYLDGVRSRLAKFKKYPRRARRRHLEGSALLAFVVDREGRVIEHRIERSAGHRLLDSEARSLIERAAPFAPIPANLNLARMHIRVPVEFSLD